MKLSKLSIQTVLASLPSLASFIALYIGAGTPSSPKEFGVSIEELLWRGRGCPLSQSGTRASPLPLYRLLRENFQFIFRVNRKKSNFMLKNGVLTTSTLSLSAAFDFWLRNSSPMKIWIDWVALGSIWLLPPLIVIVSVVMINSWVVV